MALYVHTPKLGGNYGSNHGALPQEPKTILLKRVVDCMEYLQRKCLTLTKHRLVGGCIYDWRDSQNSRFTMQYFTIKIFTHVTIFLMVLVCSLPMKGKHQLRVGNFDEENDAWKMGWHRFSSITAGIKLTPPSICISFFKIIKCQETQYRSQSYRSALKV